MSARTRRRFDYSLDYAALNLRENPWLYRVGIGEQGVLLVEPYKSEILPLWQFKTPTIARRSARAIWKQFLAYRSRGDFVGMDMSRKFLQMGCTRARRHANHRSGRKYSPQRKLLPRQTDAIKAESAQVFFTVWKKAESDEVYKRLKTLWKECLG